MAISEDQMLVLSMLRACGWGDVAESVETSGGSIVHVETRHTLTDARSQEGRSDLWHVLAAERENALRQVVFLSVLRRLTRVEAAGGVSTVEWSFAGDASPRG